MRLLNFLLVFCACICFIENCPARTFSYSDSCIASNTAFVIDDLTGVTSVLWDFGDPGSGASNTSTLNNPSHSYTISGNINVKLTINGGIEIKNKSIIIYPAPTTGNSILYACKGITVILKADTQNVMKHYLWQTGETSQTVSFKLLKDTTYTVWNYDHRECRALGTFWIKAIEINPNFNINQANQCLTGNNFVFTNTTNTTKRPWLQFVWDFNDGNTSNTLDASHSFSTAGTYNIKLWAVPKDTVDCTDTIARTIYVFDKVTPDFDEDINRCQNEVKFINKSGPAQNYFWDFGNGNRYSATNATEKYPGTGSYTVTLFTNFGTTCPDSFTKTIDITLADSLIFIPNAFSPINKDGLNDSFKVYGLDFDCFKYKLFIFSRWGEKIYDSTKFPGEPFWDGKYGSELVEQGVYTYIIIGKLLTRTGTVTVLP